MQQRNAKRFPPNSKNMQNEPWFERGAELPPNLDEDKPSRGAFGTCCFFEPVPMWEKVKVPVLLIWGEKDTVVPVNGRKSNYRKRFEKSRKFGNNVMKIFPNVNHGVVLVRINVDNMGLSAC